MTRIGHLPPKKKAVAKNDDSPAANSAFAQNLRVAKHRLIGVTGPNRPKLMISYCHADKVRANQIAQRLSSHFEILIDSRDFVLSQSTRTEMKRLVHEADLVLVLFSSDSVRSGGVQFEVRCALEREKDELRKVLFAGMIRKCKPMPDWPDDRLCANLYSDEVSELRKLVRSMIAASKRALPKAQATYNSDQLKEATLASLSLYDFVFRQEINVLGRLEESEDDTLCARMVSTEAAPYFSTYIATYLNWTAFFYFPRVALAGRRSRMFAHDRFAMRSQVDARLGGYISYLKQRQNAERDPVLDDLLRVVRRHKKVIDVVLSPHHIGSTFAQSGDVQRLVWPKVKGVLFFHKREAYLGSTALPLFLAPSLSNFAEMRDCLRCLKAALRVDLSQNAAISSTWHFNKPRLRWRSFGRPSRNIARRG